MRTEGDNIVLFNGGKHHLFKLILPYAEDGNKKSAKRSMRSFDLVIYID